MDVLMPAWFCGLPVLTYRNKTFDPEEAFHLMGKHQVRISLLTPTMLRRLSVVADPLRRHGVALRSVISGGESVGRETLDGHNVMRVEYYPSNLYSDRQRRPCSIESGNDTAESNRCDLLGRRSEHGVSGRGAPACAASARRDGADLRLIRAVSGACWPDARRRDVHPRRIGRHDVVVAARQGISPRKSLVDRHGDRCRVYREHAHGCDEPVRAADQSEAVWNEDPNELPADSDRVHTAGILNRS
jgi:hypothetical protein